VSTLTEADDDDDDDDEGWKLPPISVPLTPPTWAHTVYVVPTVVPDDGQLNVPVKVPFVTISLVALPTELNGLQLVAVLYPKVTDTDPVPESGGML